MIDLPWAKLQTADDALMGRQYMPKTRRLGPLRLAWHPGLGDAEWNRIRILDSVPHLETWIRHGLEQLTRYGGGCVEMEPGAPSKLGELLRGGTFRPLFRHVWVLYDATTASQETASQKTSAQSEDSASAIEIRELPEASPATFRHIFQEGFATDAPHGLEANWDQALCDILEQDPILDSSEYGSTHVVHCVAYWQGEAAGIASLGVHGNLAGLYNLAVLPQFRSRGIGSYLTQYRLQRAHALGADYGFLQTKDEPVLNWHLRRGAQRGPVVSGWFQQADSDAK